MSNRVEIRKQVEARVKKEAAQYPLQESVNSNSNEVTSQYLKQCLGANELGDGLLFAQLNRGHLLYDNGREEWLVFRDHCWHKDVMHEAFSCVEKVVDRFLDETVKIAADATAAIKAGEDHKRSFLEKERETIFRRVNRLRSKSGRVACLEFSRTCQYPLAISGDERDKNPYLFACRNGVLDLRIGELRKGRPDDFLSRCSPIEWKGFDERAPIWEKWLTDVFGDTELISFMQRLLGYCLLGLRQEHVFVVLWGKGRNGKGTLVSIISHVMGSLAGVVQSELLLDQGRSRSAAAPSPDILSLNGLRVAFAAETDQDRYFSSSRVKWLSGGDVLVGRNLNEKDLIRFDPTHVLFLQTNSLPHIDPDDFGFWQRCLLIPFRFSFVSKPKSDREREAVKGILEDLKAEASGILSWLVSGCLRYQEQGLEPPGIVTEATREYQRTEDLLGEFIEQHCELDEFEKELSTNLFKRFDEWFRLNHSSKGMSHTKFGRMMGKKFERVSTSEGNAYVGIRLKG